VEQRNSKYKILSFLKKEWWLVIAAIQFLLSFFYTRNIFTDSQLLGATHLQIIDGRVSELAEHVLAVIFTRLTGFSLILLVWFLIGRLCTGKIAKKNLIIFFALYAIAIVYVIFLYPEMFFIEKDSYIIFSHSIREIPYYWHHVMTGYYIGGCMVLFPHPIIIPLLQSGALVGTVCYGINGINRIKPRRGYWLLLVFLLPEIRNLMIEPYRNCFYTIMELWACLYVLFGIIEKKKISFKNLFWEVPYLAILAIWRTEGIFIGSILMVLSIIYLYDIKLKKKLIALSCFVVMILGLNSLHNIGTEKYYGKDYLLTTTMNSARAMIKNGSNLTYPGAEEDIAVINEICPDVAVEGILGYRKNNEAEGRNINQSAINKEWQSKYTKAYANLVLHNWKIFLQSQLNNAFNALGTDGIYHIDSKYGQSPEIYESYDAEYQADKVDFDNTFLTKAWENNSTRLAIRNKIEHYRIIVEKYVEPTKIPIALRFVVYVYLFVLLVKSFVASVSRRKKEWGKFLLIAALFAQLAVIVLTMPEIRESYFYAVNMCMYFVAFTFVICGKNYCCDNNRSDDCSGSNGI